MLTTQSIKSLVLDPQLYQYALLGGICAALDLTLFFSLNTYLNVHYLIPATISFIFATLLNYILCTQFVFKQSNRFNAPARITLTYLVSFIGLLIHHTSLFFAIELFGFSMLISKFLAMGSAFGWNFLSRKHFVFKQT